MVNGKTKLEWLQNGPASRKTKGLADHIAKIDFLTKVGADKLDLGLSTGMLKAQARSMLYQKPTTIRLMRGERKNLDLACFLRVQLLRLTDDGLGMIDYRIADLWRQARTRVEAAAAEELSRHQALVAQLAALADDEGASDAAVRDQMGVLLAPFLPTGRTVRPRRSAGSGGKWCQRAEQRASCWTRLHRSA